MISTESYTLKSYRGPGSTHAIPKGTVLKVHSKRVLKKNTERKKNPRYFSECILPGDNFLSLHYFLGCFFSLLLEKEKDNVCWVLSYVLHQRKSFTSWWLTEHVSLNVRKSLYIIFSEVKGDYFQRGVEEESPL